MANTYSPESLGIKAPQGGFTQGGWFSGRQYYNGTLSDPGVIHPQSPQLGAGRAVSAEVNVQSAAAQGKSVQEIESYLQAERDKQTKANITPTGSYTPADPSAGSPGSGKNALGTSGGGLAPSASIDLPSLYEKLYNTSGIKELQSEYDTITNEYNTKLEAKNKAMGIINDNPFYSEGTRVGRGAKLDMKFNDDIKAITDRQRQITDKIATQKADIETQVNIQLKQFDINSQQAKFELDKFNSLLNAGALDGATGEDIANITRATGISSNMIQSAIKTRQEQNVQTSTMSFDDGINQGFVVINEKTGEIISKQNIAPSKPKAADKPSESEKTDYYKTALRTDAQKGLKLGEIFSIYTGYLEPDLIYQLYNANSKYGPDKGNVSALAKYGVSQPSANQIIQQ